MMRKVGLMLLLCTLGGVLLSGTILLMGAGAYLVLKHTAASLLVLGGAFLLLMPLGLRTRRPAVGGEVPYEGDVEEAKGWKVAHIDPHGTYRGVAHGEYRRDAAALCSYQAHEAPQAECTCGFHAFKDQRRAQRMMLGTGASGVLEVELYGTIVEHTRGYRAAEQSVLSVHLPQRCTYCLRAADGVATLHPEGTLQAACERCRKGRIGYTREELRDLLQTEVVNDLSWRAHLSRSVR